MTSPTASRLAQTAVIGLMVLASAMLIGNVPIWIWIGSQVTESQQASFGPYMLVAAGILVTIVALVITLSRLNRLYERIVGGRRTVRVRMPWMRSMRDESKPTELTVLDTVLICTALVTVTGFGVWFFFFAGSPVPGT